jgi:hypothetical protein
MNIYRQRHSLFSCSRHMLLYTLLYMSLCFFNPAAAQAKPLPLFSTMKIGTEIAGWQMLKPAPKAADTAYSLVMTDGITVVKAEANNSMSGLIFSTRIKLSEFPLLQWRWKVNRVVKTADMQKKSGDDYAARIYVMFDYPLEKLSFTTRMKIKIATSLYEQAIPTAALNYVWDNQHTVGTLQANTYTDRARMIVLQNSAAHVGEWVTETRDLAADFRRAFGEDAPDVVAIALASDTDNTAERITAWYGDIKFLPAKPIAIAKPNNPTEK